MQNTIEVLLVLIFAADFMLVVSGRLSFCIQWTVLLGLLLGILPLFIQGMQFSHPCWNYAAAMEGIIVKGIFLPALLVCCARKTGVRQKTVLPAAYSVLIILLAAAAAFWGAGKIEASGIPGSSKFFIPAALFTIFTGFFLMAVRRETVMQVLGLIVFENGIALFGLALAVQNGWIAVLGILPDIPTAMLLAVIVFLSRHHPSGKTDGDREASSAYPGNSARNNKTALSGKSGEGMGIQP